MLKHFVGRLGGTRDDAGAAAGDGEIDPSAWLQPLFIGGTGRSGTHVTARLLDAHPAWHRIGTEVRFVSDTGGLCDLVEGRTNVKQFEKRLLGYWFQRAQGGLVRVTDRATVERVMRRHRAGLKSDTLRAARAFTHDLLDPIAAAHGAQGWIDSTPTNVMAASTLLKLFPETRLIHSVRDGRDVACSIVPLHWGPTDVDDGLDWWATRVERGFLACDSLPPDRLLVSQMEELVERDRDHEYQRLLDFLGLEDDASMHAYFDAEVTADKAHIGRWRQDVPPERLEAFQAHYRRLVDDMLARGRPYVADGRTPAVSASWSPRPVD